MKHIRHKFFKIFISLFAVTVMAFGVAGCSTDTSELQDKLDDLQSQIEQINDRMTDMEEQLDLLGGETLVGTFYTLQEAYDNGYLTHDNLQAIANYHNNGIPYSGKLSEFIAKAIKKDWAKQLTDDYSDSGENYTEDDVVINEYYGTYNGCVAVIADRFGAEYPDVDAPLIVEVDNVQFHFVLYRPKIIIWKK